MTLPAPTSAHGWVLHVHAHLASAGTLVYDFGGGVLCKVHLTPAHTSLLLALAACRAIDEREGLIVKVGCRSLAELGRIVGTMPGPGNPISANAIGGYKRAITRLIKSALEELSRDVDRPLRASVPILNRGYAQGYCLADEGLMLIGVSLGELVRAVDDEQARRSHGFSHRFPPR